MCVCVCMYLFLCVCPSPQRPTLTPAILWVPTAESTGPPPLPEDVNPPSSLCAHRYPPAILESTPSMRKQTRTAGALIKSSKHVLYYSPKADRVTSDSFCRALAVSSQRSPKDIAFARAWYLKDLLFVNYPPSSSVSFLCTCLLPALCSFSSSIYYYLSFLFFFICYDYPSSPLFCSHLVSIWVFCYSAMFIRPVDFKALLLPILLPGIQKPYTGHFEKRIDSGRDCPLSSPSIQASKDTGHQQHAEGAPVFT